MPEYKVIFRFADMQDNKHIYEVGDVYPREGATTTEARIKSLLSGANKLKQPLLEEIFVDKEQQLAELKAKAEALGIEVKPNWGVPKLTEAIAEAEKQEAAEK